MFRWHRSNLLCHLSRRGMRVFIRGLLCFGIKPEEVKVILKDNSAKLMWLD
jgi:hypothetical protein